MITYNVISHDVSSRTHPTDHLRCLGQRTEVWIPEQQVRRDDGSVGSISRWRWFVGSANDVFAGETLDAVGTNDEVCVNDFAGLEGQGWYGRIQGNNTAMGANGDARMRLCELIDDAMKVGSLCHTPSEGHTWDRGSKLNVYVIIRRIVRLFHRVTPLCPGDGLAGRPYGNKPGLERRRETQPQG